MKIIRHRQIIENVRYTRDFVYRNDAGAGFAFDCDEEGNLSPDTHESALENYRKCLSGEHDVIDWGVRKSEWSYTEPAVGLCVCGEEVELGGFTNTCEKCGRDYNWAGQELAPRHFWGEETGEHPADIARIP